MNFKNLLSAAGLAWLIAAGSSALKPIQNKHKAEVDRILSVVQPTEEDVIVSQKYYQERKDLESISDIQKTSLIMSHARLSVLTEEVKTNNMTLSDLLTILTSEDRIVTDENTKLKISTNFWKDIGALSCQGDQLEITTDARSPNRILRNFSLSQVELKGGELTVSFSWTEFETEARADKEQLSASLGTTEVWPATYSISVGLVLAH